MKRPKNQRKIDTGPRLPPSFDSLQTALICLALTALVFAIFLPACDLGFLLYDDPDYVSSNRWVQEGLSFHTLFLAFTRIHSFNWHPLTTLSHMADCQFFGLSPGAHHLTNLVLHASTTVVLFLALKALTREIWPSAAVAALFSIHPLRVESVVWISERKDVLSGLFFGLLLWSYAHFARAESKNIRARKFYYSASLVSLGLGLLSKPILVTAPFVLLLLDYWPLGRFSRISDWKKLVLEKWPFLALSLISCRMTLWAQTNAMSYDQVGSFSDRAVNAAVSLGEYFKSWVWPQGLTVFYPYSSNLHHPTLVMVSLAFLFLFTLFATAVRKRLPFVLVGWLWFLGMMVPVLGLVQVGVQARADRYTYLPQIGLAVAVVWLAQRTRLPRVMVWTCFALVISGFAWKTRQQVEFWRDDETLWRHTLQHTESNHVAHMNLGVALAAQKRIPEAVSELKKALEIKPSDGKSNYNLGLLLQQSGQNEEALGHFRIAANNSLAPEAHYELGFTLFELRQFDESIVELQKAIQINPNQPESHYTLAQSLLNKGEGRRAIQQMQEGLRYSPNDLTLTCYLSYLLSTHPEKEYRDGNQALGLAQKALAFKSPNSTWTLAVLGAAQAENGDFSHATESAEKALTEAEKLGNPALLQVIQNQLSLYRQNRPFRDPSLGGAISEAIAP